MLSSIMWLYSQLMRLWSYDMMFNNVGLNDLLFNIYCFMYDLWKIMWVSQYLRRASCIKKMSDVAHEPLWYRILKRVFHYHWNKISYIYMYIYIKTINIILKTLSDHTVIDNWRCKLCKCRYFWFLATYVYTIIRLYHIKLSSHK